MRRVKHRLPDLPDLPRNVSFPGGSSAIVIPYLWEVTAADWDGTSLVGDGITFSQATPTSRPTTVGDALVFDGVDDLLSATVTSMDLKGKTLIWVMKPGTTDNAQDAILSMLGPSALEISVCGQTVGTFKSQLRTSAFGAGSTLVTPTNPRAVVYDRTDEKFIGFLRVRTDEVLICNGHQAAEKTTLTAGAKNVTSFRLGASASGFRCPVSFYEMALIDSTDDDVIHAACATIAARHSLTAPNVTPFLCGDARIFGDSISLGIGATNSYEGHLEQVCDAMICDTAKSGLADVQMSPYGFTVPTNNTKIAACFSRVTASAGLYTGMNLILCHFGGNDYGTGVPLGDINSADEETFYGALNVGADNLDANRGSTPVVMTGLYFASVDPGTNGIGLSRDDYRAAISAVCAARGYTYVEMGDIGINAGNAATYLDDGVHPTTAGYTLGANRLKPYVLGL